MNDRVRYLRVREVASRLRVDPRTVYRMIERGELDGVRTGRNWRVLESSIPGSAAAPGGVADRAVITHDLDNALVALRGLVDVLGRLEDFEHERRRAIERRLAPLVDRVATAAARLV